MKPIEITENVWRLGVNMDRDSLFEGMWPIPSGVSINAYVIRGSEKTAVIDLTHSRESYPRELDAQMREIGLDPEGVDYLVINHMEPDHSGYLGDFFRANPKMTLLGTGKCLDLIRDFTGIDHSLREVKAGETLDLGGRVLQFVPMPNVHWPETMATYEQESGILFSCDAFGSYGSVEEERVFDDQNSREELAFYEKEAERYYANIVANFSPFVLRAAKALGELDIKAIAPSHGLIWRRDPSRIVDLYGRLAGYAKGPQEKQVTLIWGSMYGNTEALVQSVKEGIESEEVPVKVYRVPEEDHGFILGEAWKSEGIVLGMPTYEYKMFPPMAHAVDELLRKGVKGRKAFRFGSYGWSGGAQKELDRMMEKSGWEFLPSLEWAGKPGPEELAVARDRGAELARAVLGRE